MSQKNQIAKLFLGTFVSAFLFFFGAFTLGSLFIPYIAESAKITPVYHPQLTLSANRDEAFLDINSIPVRQLYPSLTDITPAPSGNAIIIPAINVNVPIALSPTMDDKDIITTLMQGAALYPNGISPGHLGNVFIAAHSTGEPWKGKYRFAFSKINELQLGNDISVDYNNIRYTYRITKKDLVKPTTDSQIVSDRPMPTITLMACWPLWTTNQRMLITGELTNITQLTKAPS
jgi:LPXTG-site transpeptidase (sortase) family protein